jgi:hypothetical protein
MYNSVNQSSERAVSVSLISNSSFRCQVQSLRIFGDTEQRIYVLRAG